MELVRSNGYNQGIWRFQVMHYAGFTSISQGHAERLQWSTEIGVTLLYTEAYEVWLRVTPRFSLNYTFWGPLPLQNRQNFQNKL